MDTIQPRYSVIHRVFVDVDVCIEVERLFIIRRGETYVAFSTC